MSDPETGESVNTPETGESVTTPADLDVKKIQDQYFRKGQGKGRAEGRLEGQATAKSELLAALGLDDESDLDDARARLQGPPPEDSAREIGLLNRKVTEYEKDFEISKARSDRYRLSELKAAALQAGVRPTMADDFSTIVSPHVGWDGADLVIFDRDGKQTGETIPEYVARVLKEKPDWQAPRNMEGAGDQEAKKVRPARRTSMRSDHLSVQERLAGKR